MKEDQVLLLWKQGHTREYLYQEEYKSLKYQFQNVKRKAKVLQDQGKINIERILYEDYMKNLKKGSDENEISIRNKFKK